MYCPGSRRSVAVPERKSCGGRKISSVGATLCFAGAGTGVAAIKNVVAIVHNRRKPIEKQRFINALIDPIDMRYQNGELLAAYRPVEISLGAKVGKDDAYLGLERTDIRGRGQSTLLVCWVGFL